MFTDRYFGKKRGKRRASKGPETTTEGPSAAPAPSPSAPTETGRAGATASADGFEEGLSLEAFAKAHAMTETEVWRRLRRGEIVGRTHRGRLTIYTSQAAAEAAESSVAHESTRPTPPSADSAQDSVTFGAWAASHHHDPLEELHHSLADAARAGDSPLPPLPDEHGFGQDARVGATSAPGTTPNYLALTEGKAASPELALLLDHLSLAKEENREILRMTQESIRKVTELTDSIVEMKDAVIEAKDTQILTLKEQLEAKDREMRKLLQQKEDLEMLARTMAKTPRS